MTSNCSNATFAALADPTRRAILARLAGGEASVMELAEPFDMSQPAISKHLKVLERAGLVVPGQDAQRRPRKLECEAACGRVSAGSKPIASIGKPLSRASTKCSRSSRRKRKETEAKEQ